MNAAAWAVTAAGAGLLGLVALDIYRTILHSRSRSGPVTEALTRAVWRLVRVAAFRRSRAGREGVPTVEERARWRQRYESTLRRLRGADVRLPADLEAGWREYRHRRHGWELELAGFDLYLGYDWEEVTGDGDLRLAAE
jgi:hypothetical protein